MKFNGKEWVDWLQFLKLKMLYNGFRWIIKKEDTFQTLCIFRILYKDTNIYTSQLKGIYLILDVYKFVRLLFYTFL